MMTHSGRNGSERRSLWLSARWTALLGATTATVLLGSSIAMAADGIRGGQMYDEWWAVNGAAEPQGEHPLYPTDVNSAQRGSVTFRCKECHGWDYKGAEGAYKKGSHFTGIRGVLGTAMSAQEIADLLKNPAAVTPNGHDLASYGLSDEDAEDLAHFVTTLLIDTDDFVDADKGLKGDASQGSIWYHHQEQGACRNCHGLDGTQLNFGDEEEPEWVGTVAVDNPWEFLHKVRFGHPGSIMPSWTRQGGSNQGAADIGRYIQDGNFPVTAPVVPPVVGEFKVQSGSAKLAKSGWTVKAKGTYTGSNGASDLQVLVDGEDYFEGQTPTNGKNGKLTLSSDGNKVTVQPSSGKIKIVMKKLEQDDLDPSDGVSIAVRLGSTSGSVVVPVTVRNATLTEATGSVHDESVQ